MGTFMHSLWLKSPKLIMDLVLTQKLKYRMPTLVTYDWPLLKRETLMWLDRRSEAQNKTQR